MALFLSVLATLFSAWHLGSLTKALVVMGAAAVAPIVVAHMIPEEEIAWTPWAAADVLMFVLGRNLRRQRVLIEQLGAARVALAEQAVADERHRIARDLHDLAGHTLVTVLLHVTGARHVLRRDLDEAERALLQAETVGRGAWTRSGRPWRRCGQPSGGRIPPCRARPSSSSWSRSTAAPAST